MYFIALPQTRAKLLLQAKEKEIHEAATVQNDIGGDEPPTTDRTEETSSPETIQVLQRAYAERETAIAEAAEATSALEAERTRALEAAVKAQKELVREKELMAAQWEAKMAAVVATWEAKYEGAEGAIFPHPIPMG